MTTGWRVRRDIGPWLSTYPDWLPAASAARDDRDELQRLGWQPEPPRRPWWRRWLRRLLKS